MLMLVGFTSFQSMAQDNRPALPPDYQVDTRIDNIGYWQRCAEWGLVPVEPFSVIPPAVYTGSKVIMRGKSLIDSPDVCTTNEPSNSTQSENSLAGNPTDVHMLLNSNNSTPQPSTGSVKGADAMKSLDAGLTWSGTVEGAGGSNNGDPAAAINMNGRFFVGYIDNGGHQSVSYSDNQGGTWSTSVVSNHGSTFNILDKNHLWVDIGPTSPYKNNAYVGWMESNNIWIARSITNGTTWEPQINISAATAAGSHNQGINFKCGPDGEVYGAWAVYDSWPSDEKAVGFAKSLDGGVTWQPAIRAINNIRGIRTTGVSQNMRTNSFPCMAVDLSNSPYRGTIYIVWTNIGVPGVNTGSGSSAYMIKSTDKGATWSAAKRINSDSTAGKNHYLPWITCDQATGYVSVVFYDNRNCATNEAEAWMAYSTNGGDTFEDMKVSDVKFTPAPIPNMASKYMGDYLAITAYAGKTFPCWTDTRSGHCLTYVSPIDILIPQAVIENVDRSLNDTTFGNSNGLMDYGETELMGLKMKNTGTGTADAVSVKLLCDNPYITMIDSIEPYGHFDPDQSRYINNGYKFKVSDSIANHELVTFTVKATDSKDSVTWSSFQMLSQAPDVSILSMTILDPLPGGNNNGRLDPGESATIKIETKNQGIWDAESVVSNLMSMNNYVTVTSSVFNIGTLHAGETVQATFAVKVHPSAPIGSVAVLHNIATSRYRTTEREFSAKIGLIIEDWETGNFTKFAWHFTNALKPWTIDPNIKYEKLYSARSGVIGDSDTTGLYINYNAAIDDSISFFRRVSTQPIKDNLKFYIDNLLVGMWSNNNDTTFRRMAYPVLAGPHTFKWTYEKNASVAGGMDATWVDYIVFPPEYKTAVNAGGNGETCAGSTYQLHGMAYSYDSLHWVTSGTGTFSNIHILDPVYTPSTQDVTAGLVSLTLKAYGQGGVDTTNTMVLTIAKTPVASAGGNGTVCKGSSFTPSSATATNYHALLWTSKGDGVFSKDTILHPAYTPGTLDKQHGSVKLFLRAAGSETCPTSSDSLLLTIVLPPAVEIGRDTLACANTAVVLNATSPDASSYLWLPSNKTTASITVDSTGIGLHTKLIKVVVTGTNGCVTRDSVNVGFKVCGGIDELSDVNIRIFPNPSHGEFTVELQSPNNYVVDFTLLNSNSQVIYSSLKNNIDGLFTKKISVNDLPQGSYLLKISDGKRLTTKKIIISK